METTKLAQVRPIQERVRGRGGERSGIRVGGEGEKGAHLLLLLLDIEARTASDAKLRTARVAGCYFHFVPLMRVQ